MFINRWTGIHQQGIAHCYQCVTQSHKIYLILKPYSKILYIILAVVDKQINQDFIELLKVNYYRTFSKNLAKLKQ